MDSTGASVSLNGSCTTAAAAADSPNAVPHYLRPSTGSCHDICKYGRRRASEELPTKPMHKTTAKLSIVVPSHRKKDGGQPSPSSDAKSFSPGAKNRSWRRNTSSDAPQVVKRGTKLSGKAQTQVNGSSSVDSKMSKQRGRQLKTPLMAEPSELSRDSSDGVRGKRRRNEDVPSGGKRIWIPVGASLSSNTSTTLELLSPRKDRKRVKRVKTDASNASVPVPSPPSPSCQGEGNQNRECPRTGTESNGLEFKFEAVAEAPSSSSHVGDNEESDKLASDTTVSQGKRNRIKRRRKSRVVKSGDDHNPPVKLKFRTRVDKMRAEDSVSDSSKSLRIPPRPLRDRHRSSRSRRKRVKYGKTRILMLEDRRGESRRSYEEGDASLLWRKNNLKHQDVPRKKEVQCLFNNVIEETASKLAERRKGTVKSLVGAYETLISLQARKRIFQLRKMNG